MAARGWRFGEVGCLMSFGDRGQATVIVTDARELARPERTYGLAWIDTGWKWKEKRKE